MKQTPPLLFFPKFIVRSWRWMETPSGRMTDSWIEGSSQVSVKTITLQFLTSRWKAILRLSSSSLLSSNWTIAKQMFGRGTKCGSDELSSASDRAILCVCICLKSWKKILEFEFQSKQEVMNNKKQTLALKDLLQTFHSIRTVCIKIYQSIRIKSFKNKWQFW